MEKLKKNSIAFSEMVKIGGIEQFILIRGKDKSNPVLLLLHGGPGGPETHFTNGYQDLLEEYFVVVNWDQRGAGKSFSEKIPPETMNVNQFISDTHELVNILRKRFNKEKIYMRGHSFGGLLGMKFIHRYPELFHAYMVLNPIVNRMEGQKISYEFSISKAKKEGNQRAIKELESIGPLPVKDAAKRNIKFNWLTYYGGVLYGEKTMFKSFQLLFASPEYSDSDKEKVIRGSLFSENSLWDELLSTNLFEEISAVKIPVYFGIGRYDYTTPFELAERYFNQLKSPQKEFIWFEKSAHMPMLSEAEKVQKVIIKKFLGKAL